VKKEAGPIERVGVSPRPVREKKADPIGRAHYQWASVKLPTCCALLARSLWFPGVFNHTTGMGRLVLGASCSDERPGASSLSGGLAPL
jgi:hypothetical protein